MRATARAVLFLLVASACAPRLFAQDGCTPPPAATGAAGPNIFSPDQEIALGDALAERLQGSLRITDDPAVASGLQRIGDRLTKHLPPNQMQFRYYLVDLPTPNAFSIAGGRIHVSRKLVAFVRSEDEMADILAHEMGHIATHQSAVDFTKLFGAVLGVKAVRNRKDVFDRVHELSENWRRNPKAFRILGQEEEGQQLVADNVAIYVAARAGYAPGSFFEVFDRVTESGGKMGTWLSDFLRTTTPNQRRLREMTSLVQDLPAACVDRQASADGAAFKSWQSAVVQYDGWNRREALHGVTAKVLLEPPLRAPIDWLRFSPDGKYVLAQDADKISVITVTPLRFVFSIDAPQAVAAQFTPDSSAVVFHTDHLRVETWDIEGRSRRTVYEPVVPKGCTRSTLAADGKTLACVTPEGSLLVLDVPSGSVLLEKRSFARVLPSVHFSPDGHYLLAATWDRSLGFDVREKSEVKLREPLAGDIMGGFGFLGNDRVVGKNIHTPGVASIMEFPSGKHVRDVPAGGLPFGTPTRGDFLLLYRVYFGKPDKDEDESDPTVLGVYDLDTRKVIAADKRADLDIYDDLMVRELRDGTVALYQTSTKKLLSQASVPGSDLAGLRALAVSPDLAWLAVSERARGAVWNLADGTGLYLLRGFDGAGFPGDGYLYGDFPKDQKTPRGVQRLSLTEHEILPGFNIDDDVRAHQHGRYLAVITPKHSGNFASGVTYEIRDVRTGKPVWSREFPKAGPRLAVEEQQGTLSLCWSAGTGEARAEVARYPELAGRLAGAQDKKWDNLIESFSLESGRPMGAALVDTGKGSFAITDFFAQGNRVVLFNNQGRVLIYSLATGEKLGEAAGAWPVVSAAAGLLSVRSENSELTLYDLNTMDQIDQYAFSSPVVLDQFSADGRRLLVITADQTAYFLDVSGAARTPAATQQAGH